VQMILVLGIPNEVVAGKKQQGERLMNRTAKVLLVWLVFLLSSMLAVPSPNPWLRIPSELLVYLLPLAFIWHLTRKGFWKSIRLTRENLSGSILWALALFVVFFLLLGMASAAVLKLMGKSEQESREEFENYIKAQPQWYRYYLLPASFFPIAFSEEAVFRGYVLQTLLPLGPAASILISSLLHLSLHLWYFDLEAAPLLFVQAFILFTWFGLVSYLSRNITGAILMHGLTNFLSILWGFSQTAASAIQTALLILGCFSIFVLVLSHLGRRFERKLREQMELNLQMNLRKLERMRDGLKKMLAEIKKRYRRGEMEEKDFLRLRATYERRIEEVERVLSSRKERKESVRV